jgi:hypothetical protein
MLLDVIDHSHRGFAYLALLLSVAWIVVVLTSNPATGLTRAGRIVYAAGMAVTGLVAIAGLSLLVVGPWAGTSFPWIGVIVVVLYGFVGATSRRALQAGRKTEATLGSIVMLILLVFAYSMMVWKPF